MNRLWMRHAALGGTVGLALALVIEFGRNGPGLGLAAYVLVPGLGLGALVTRREPGLLHSVSDVVANAAVCSLVAVGLCASGRMKWSGRIAGAILYVASVALSMRVGF